MRPAVAILAERGYEVWAATGKDEAHAELLALGAAGILPREEVTADSPRPLERERWAGAVDCVGAATLPYILRTLRWGGAVAASGNTSGAAFGTTVFPFILRGAAILGIDSAQLPIDERRALWARRDPGGACPGALDRPAALTPTAPRRTVAGLAMTATPSDRVVRPTPAQGGATCR